MSPLDSWYAETSILAFHFAEHFKPFPIHIVLGRGPGVQHNVPWVRSVNRFSDIAKTGFVPGESDQDGPVVIVAGVPTRDLKLLERFAERVTNVDAFILLNCAIDAPLSTQIRPFTRVFTCRALDKLAVMQESMGGNWSVFIEIAVFEYEWVGDCESSWTPKQKAAEAFAYGRDAKRRGINGYFETPYAGCEAGFWPFMTVSSREVLPLDGKLLARQAREKAQKKARRGGKPFGFF